MREQTMQALAQILANNVGNKLTVELANGLAVTFNQALDQIEAAEKAENTPSQPT